MHEFYAHSGTPGDKSDWQTLRDHLLAVAEMAADFARPFGLEKAAFVAGLFHDLGKYDPDFQRRLEGAALRVAHSTAGAAVLRSLANSNDADAAMTQLVMYGGADRNSPQTKRPCRVEGRSPCGGADRNC